MDNFLTPLINEISDSKNGLQPKESEASVLSTNGNMALEKPIEISANKSTPSSSFKYDS